MENFEEKACLCALNRIFGFEPKIAKALLEHYGSATEVMTMNQNEVTLVLGPHSKYSSQINRKNVDSAKRELESLDRSGIRFLGATERDFPSALLDCPDSPAGLYIKSCSSDSEIFNDQEGIAIVGTRDISLYGQEWCKKIVLDLSETDCKPVIVSGLALGTDICAHQSAIDSGLRTIAVMATGPDTIYPWKHKNFADRLVSTPGCALITDYPPGTAPLAIHFLRRNRIIAGLSRATILIESKTRGGGMTTARLAFSYGREVYALPGRVDDTRSQGCNYLIKNKIAEPLTCPAELIKDLGYRTVLQGSGKKDNTHGILQKYTGVLPEDKVGQMAAILLAIRGSRGITLEEITEVTELQYNRVAELTSILECDGIITIDLLQRCIIKI